ncbi:TIGR04141 family sporadically distributed protein [Aeromonas media]|uniref:TIGR04141 family sporadically distributed protein n=1 Tax=Aeromonas media TaxID=651 RepID=UPI00370CD303
MKLNTIAYLIKEGVDAKNAVDPKKVPKGITFIIAERECVLYLSESFNTPKWAELFNSIEGIEDFNFSTKSLKGLLIIPSEKRHLAFTFGYGKSMLYSHMIERGFGLRVALNIGDAEKIKSIDKSTLDRVSLKTKSQTSKSTNVNDFDFEFEFDQEILKSICASIENDNEMNEVVSGSDAVSLYTDVELASLPDIADRLISAYKEQTYKEKYPWVDFIQPISDPTLVGMLNENIMSSINDGLLENIWISPPEVIDYSDLSGFVYRSSKNHSPCFHNELNLNILIKEAHMRKPISVDSLKRRKIKRFNASEQEVGSWSVYHCLNAEVLLGNETYILNDEYWYRVNSDFSESINSFFEGMDRADIDFPDFNGMNEAEYLITVADGENFALLDRKLIRPINTGNRIEFCDLFSQCNAFIHVKKYSSSSVLSHLFAQASVAIDCLMNDPSVQPQVNKYLEDTYLSLRFNNEDSPRKYRVVLAIMQGTPGELHLPFFSKVNLRHHARRLTNMGFKVEIAKIHSSRSRLKTSI